VIHGVGFEQFRDAITSLPLRNEYQREDLICARFRLLTDRGLEVYYAPFHYLNRDARLVLVGLTPGWTQMELSYREARSGLAAGLSDDEIFYRIEMKASFGGRLRDNLVQMLDGVGLRQCLGVSCSELFERRVSNFVHFTSILSAPIFRGGENYRGAGPHPFEVPYLRNWIFEYLPSELLSVPLALVVPLGKIANEAIHVLCQQGKLDSSRCLIGFPHPSGANGHRGNIYEAGKSKWMTQIMRWLSSQPSV